MNLTTARKLVFLKLIVLLFCVAMARSISAADTNAVAPASLYEGPAVLTGSIYAKDSNPRKLLYNFQRRATRSGSKVNIVREYTNPDGTPAARERVFYDGDKLVSYELDELQINAVGSARIELEPGGGGKGKIAFEYNKDAHDKNSVKSSTENLHPDTLVGDMIATFLRVHWNELFRGEKVKCRYIVVPRRETVGFTFVKDSETTIDGHPVLVVRMEATSALIATLVDPLYFSVDKESGHRVVQYTGRVVPKIKKGDKWDDLDALVIFDWKE